MKKMEVAVAKEFKYGSSTEELEDVQIEETPAEDFKPKTED